MADFFRPNEVPTSLKPSGFNQGRAAALMIATSERGCSATIISRDGHIATALHCIRSCMSFNKVSSLKGFKAVAPDMRAVQGGKANCRLEISQEGRSLGNVKAQIVAVGAGYVEETKIDDLRKAVDRKPETKQAFSSLMSAGVGIPGDYAILKVPNLANRTCVRVASEPLRGTRIWNIAYPAQTSRAGGRGTPGNIAVFSSGAVTRGSINHASELVTDGRDAAARLTARPGIVISSVDSNEGSSGSALLNEAGDIVAILNSMGKDAGAPRYSVTLERVRAEVSSRFGSNVAAAAFNCQ